MQTKKRRPLITKKDMAKLVSAARKFHLEMEEPVQVLTLIRATLHGRHPTNQMRVLVGRKLDELGIPRLRKADATPKPATSRKVKFKAAEPDNANKVPESVPGVLGGIEGDVIDVSFELPDPIAELDDFLAEQAALGNSRAMRLLKSQIRGF